MVIHCNIWASLREPHTYEVIGEICAMTRFVVANNDAEHSTDNLQPFKVAISYVTRETFEEREARMEHMRKKKPWIALLKEGKRGANPSANHRWLKQTPQ